MKNILLKNILIALLMLPMLALAQNRDVIAMDSLYNAKLAKLNRDTQKMSIKDRTPLFDALTKERIDALEKLITEVGQKAPNTDISLVPEYAEKDAKFENGYEEFRRQLFNGIRMDAIPNLGKPEKTVLQFVVNEDGSISNVTATGDNRALNTEMLVSFYHIAGKWIPAEYNNEKIKDIISIPITLNFQ